MPTLGITGGIATGKSTFMRALLRHLAGRRSSMPMPPPTQLLASDPGVREAVRARFGPEAFRFDGTPDRDAPARRWFSPIPRCVETRGDPASGHSRALDRAGRASTVRAAAGSSSISRSFMKPEAETHFDRVVVVACSPETQRARLRDASRLDRCHDSKNHCRPARSRDEDREGRPRDLERFHGYLPRRAGPTLSWLASPILCLKRLLSRRPIPLNREPTLPPRKWRRRPLSSPRSSGSTSSTQAPFHELLERAEGLDVRINPDKTRHHLVFDLLRAYAARGTELFADGMLELGPQGSGFLRWPRYNFARCRRTSSSPARSSASSSSATATGSPARIRPPRDREQFHDDRARAQHRGHPGRTSGRRRSSSTSSPRSIPSERIVLENPKTRSITTRAIDLIAPLGRGQRGLIVAPPRTGKTILLKDIAQSILRQFARDATSSCCLSMSARRK